MSRSGHVGEGELDGGVQRTGEENNPIHDAARQTRAPLRLMNRPPSSHGKYTAY